MTFINLCLPGVTEMVHKVQFWPEERKRYEVLETEAKGLLVNYQQDSVKGQDSYRFLLKILLRVRQVTKTLSSAPRSSPIGH